MAEKLPHDSQAEVMRAADDLMTRHGRDAVLVAAMKAAELEERGDVDGYQLMKRVALVVDEIFAETPPGQEPIH